MKTTFPINNVPGKNGTFNTVALLSIGIPNKTMRDGCSMGFKVHVPSLVIGVSMDTAEHIMDCIKHEGWHPFSYEHVLYDEAFVKITHADNMSMIVHSQISS